MRRDPEKLQAHLDKWRDLPLDYHANDCAKFAADWAGVTIDRYASKFAALRYIARSGCKRSADVVSQHLKQLDRPELARWGDVVGIDTPPLDTLGICEGSRVVFLSGDGGYIRKPLRQCHRAWRVN